MKRKSLLKSLLLPAALLVFLRGQAQNAFAYSAPLDSISQAGFYKIVLLPDVTAKCKEDLSDLRIDDPHGQFIPYVLRSDLPSKAGEGFSEFPILPIKAGLDSANDVLIANWSSSPIYSLLLYIRNISSRRVITLSGSDDRQKWFVIKEHIILEPEEDNNTVYYIQHINFPASNYRYFKIIQEDKNVLPVNIIRAGIPTQHVTGGDFRPVPKPKIEQKDSSNHHSYVKLIYDDPYLIDRLDLDIKGPILYKRKARIFTKETPFTELMVELDTAHHSIGIPSIKTRELLIDINNEDNAPLIINQANTSQLERYLLAYLQPGAGYKLLAGNSQAGVPEYDLKYFIDSASLEPKEIIPGSLLSTNPHPIPPVAKPGDNKGIYLWGAIIVVLAMLIWLSFNMLTSIRESRKNQELK